MKKIGWNKWQIVGGLIGTALVVAGVGFTVARYRDGSYEPDLYAGIRDKRENQIIFPGQDISADSGESGDSELWEQKDDSSDKLNPENRPSASLLFQTKKVADADLAEDDPANGNTDVDTDETVYSRKNNKNNNKNNDKTIIDDNGSGDGRPGNNVPRGDGDSRSDNTGGNTDKPGNDNRKPDKDDGSDDNKPGNDSDDNGNDDNKPGKDDDRNDDNKPGGDDDNIIDPGSDINDLDTTVPTLPKDDSIISADPYPGDDKIDISDDEDYARYSLKVIGIRDIDDKINSLYMGEYLNDQRVLCSVIVYVCVDGVPKYRLTELGDNFRIGTYPQQVKTDTVDLTFYYRPSEKYQWISGTYTSSVLYSAKLMLQDWTEGNYVEQYLVPNDNNKVMLFQYYRQMDDADTGDVDRLFLGWSDTKDGKSVGPFYNVENTGAKIMYPVAGDAAAPDSTVQWEKYGMDIDGSFYYKDMQTLTYYNSDDDLLDIQDGVQAVSLPVDIDWDTFELVIKTFDKVRVPASVMNLGGAYGDSSQAGSYSFNVMGEYEVDEANQVYSSSDGMLLDKERTVIYDIPRNKVYITVPGTVRNIHFAADNNLSEIHMNSAKPANIDFTALNNVKIYVPADSYIRYLAAWGKNPGGNNQLLPDDGREPGFVQDDNAIYTEDGKTLISVKSSVDGVYVVPDGVENIAERALENCGQIDLMIVPESLKRLERESLSVNAPSKIVFLGSNAPSVESDTFGESTIFQIRKSAENEYSEAWSDKVPDMDGRTCYREFRYVCDGTDGFEYLDEEACDDDADGAILIRAADDITYFDANTVEGVVWKSIAPRAFVHCSRLYMVELPDTVKNVGRCAFDGCSALQGVVSYSMDSITIGEGAFDNTWNLRFMAFDALDLECYTYWGSAAMYASSNGSGYMNADRFSPEYFIEDVSGGKLLYGAASDEDGNATENCFLLGATLGVSGDITLLPTATEIASGVFYGCANEFVVNGLDHIIAIGENAFRNSGITGEIHIVGSCEYVGDYAFSGCAGITGVKLDGSGLNKLYYVRPLGSGVFSWCTGIEYVAVTGGGYYDLCESAFMGCSGLTDVDIDENAGISDVMYGAFSGTAIAELTLPNGLKGIGYGAFDSCYELKRVVLTGTAVPELYVYGPGMQFSFGLTDESGWLVVPEESRQAYVDLWKFYMLGRIPEDVPFISSDELLESENAVRKLLGMPEVSGDNGDSKDDDIATATDAYRAETVTEIREDKQ